MLGEYVAPRNRDVYRDVYVAALETLGYRTHAARQALARSVAAGWLRSRRVGRRSLMSISEPTFAMLRAGYPRIYGFGEPWRWSGKWALVVVRVPEEQREIRDRMRTQLAWAGFGSLGGGLWISPHPSRDGELITSLNHDRGAAEMLSFSAEIAAVGDPVEIVARAWDLDGIADQYRVFVANFSEAEPSSPGEMFSAQTAIVHAWRKFPFIDPDLPQELLPPDWPRGQARALFRDRRARWARHAEAYFDRL